MPSVLDQVRAYQHVIEKYPQDQQRVLRYIDKLFRLDVTVGHLQETGVGRTVNALRKEPGDIGKAARALVYKWKLMVAAEESDQEEDRESKATTEIRNGKETEPPITRQSSYPTNTTPKSQPEQHQINGDHSGTKRKQYRNGEEEPEVKRKKSNHSSDEDHHNRKFKSESESQDSSDSQSDGETDSESDSEQDTKHNDLSHNIKTEPLDETKTSSKHSNHQYDDNQHKIKSESSSNKDSKHSSSSRHSSDRKDKHSSKNRNSKEAETQKHRDHKEEAETNSLKHRDHKERKEKHEITPSKDKKHSKEEQSSKHSSEHRSISQKPDSGSERSRDKSSSKSEKHSSSHKSDKDKHKGSETDVPTEKHRSKEREHKSKHDASKEHKSKDSGSDSKNKSSSSKDKSKESSSSKEKSRSHHSDKSDKKSLSDKSKSDNKIRGKDERSSEKKSSHKSTSSSSHKSSSSKSRDEIPKKKVHSSPGDDDGGIGCESGASFAEALGMIKPTKSKKKEKTTPVKDVSQSSSTNTINSDLSPAALLAPTAKLAPLPALEISALPEISPNYKPRPPPKFLPHFNDDAMSCAISSKNQRTKIYSGNKVTGVIPSLYDLCVNVLQEHIDALEYTGGVPYDILKPVIDKATPQQLFMLEHYNAYLIEDTDHLWMKHVEKHFRNKKREEMETWREMYLRCQEEQEYKLKSLTENIKLTQEAKKAPIKQTKMAYVDSVVKPPRNIARQQAVHGTKYAATASPAARVAALAAAPNVLRGGVRPSPGAPVSVASFNKPKKAPLMQKALQFMRGRKR